MREFADQDQRERGFTLIELIASLTLLSIVGGIIFSVVMFGMNTYGKIEAENSLRDDADLLMSSIITELYTYAPETISVQGTEMVLRTAEEEKVIKFNDNQLEIGNRVIDARSDINSETSMSLTCSASAAQCSSGLLTITLVLEQNRNGHNQQLTLESRFGF